MNKPNLYVFSISHYCEKARWSLDYFDLDYQVQHLAPGPHIAVARKMGLASSSLPILSDHAKVIQGSSAIVDWAENQFSVLVSSSASSSASSSVSPPTQPSKTRSLTPDSLEDTWAEVEQRLDDRLGVHVRRYCYSEALVEYPQTVRPIFFENLSLLQKLMLGGSWNIVRRKMIDRMDLGLDQGLASKAIVEAELDWLDSRLGDGKEFLLGRSFSRVDISAASLLAPLVIPPQHPSYAKLAVPPRLSRDLITWNERPVFQWVRKIYKQFR